MRNGMSSRVIEQWVVENEELIRYCLTGDHPLLPRMKRGTCIAGTGGGTKLHEMNKDAVKAYKTRARRPCKVKMKSLKNIWLK
jgi:hypothetical protein